MRYDIYEGVIASRSKLQKFIIGAAALAFAAALAIATGGTQAASGYSLFGDAEIVGDGNPGNAAQLRSDTAPGWGGIDFNVPSGITTFADLTTLSADFNVTDDNCAGGSPRFQVNVATGSDIKNIFIYLGPYPNYNTCTPNTWTSSGNLLDGDNTHRLDTGQLPGGTFYDTYSNALANYGSYPITGIQIVVDSNWAFPPPDDSEQTVLIDNVILNSKVHTFGDKQKLATGGVTLTGPRQQLSFTAHDYGPTAADMGVVNYSNFSAGLHYNADITCANVNGDTAYFAYQIPPGNFVSGLWIVWEVTDGGSPGKGNDTAGFVVASDENDANTKCETGDFTPSDYTIIAGNLVVH